MKIIFNFASDNIFRGNLKNFFKLTIDVSDDKKKFVKESTKPVFLIPVIDRSGSMCSFASEKNGRGTLPLKTKLDCALDATCELLDLLNEGDKFAVVSFDDQVKIEQCPIEVNAKNKNEIRQNIHRISCGGCTNISEALSTASNLFTDDDTQNYNCKIVLLSDGCANVGLSKEVQFVDFMPTILNRSISTSTVGLGNDYDLGIMEAISGNCGGSFNHISNALAIKDIFVSELKTAQDIVCRNAIVNVALPDLVAFKPNYNNYNEEVAKEGIRIQLGNLYSNKTIYYEFSVLDETIKEIEIEASVSYETLDGGQNTATMSRKLPIVDDRKELIENENIVNEFVGAIKDKYVYAASKAVSACDFATATSSYKENSEQMQSILSAYNCCAAISMNEMDDIHSSLTASTSQDTLRKTFNASSKKLRNS